MYQVFFRRVGCLLCRLPTAQQEYHLKCLVVAAVSSDSSIHTNNSSGVLYCCCIHCCIKCIKYAEHTQQFSGCMLLPNAYAGYMKVAAAAVNSSLCAAGRLKHHIVSIPTLSLR